MHGTACERYLLFLANRPKITLEDYMGYNCSGRGNLGEDVPVFVYRMLKYSLKEILSDTYGKDVQVEVFRKAGFKAGTFFARKILDTGLEFSAFVAQLQQKLQEKELYEMCAAMEKAQECQKVSEPSGRIWEAKDSQGRIYEFVEIVFLFIDKINKTYR